MKPPPSGAGAKRKSYYLENAMHFCLPFIKTSAPPSSEICHQYHSTLLVKLLKTQKYGRIVHPKWIHHKHLYLHKHHSLTLQYIHRFNIVIQPRIQHHLNKQLIHRYSFHRPLKPRKNYLWKKTSAADADHSVSEYFNAKRARLQMNKAENSSQKIDRQQGIKMFLLSLIPELEDLSDSQIKLFKRRVFNIIDDISTPQYQLQASTFHTMIPSVSDSSQMSHMSQTTDFYNDFSQGLQDSDIYIVFKKNM